VGDKEGRVTQGGGGNVPSLATVHSGPTQDPGVEVQAASKGPSKAGNAAWSLHGSTCLRPGLQTAYLVALYATRQVPQQEHVSRHSRAAPVSKAGMSVCAFHARLRQGAHMDVVGQVLDVLPGLRLACAVTWEQLPELASVGLAVPVECMPAS